MRTEQTQLHGKGGEKEEGRRVFAHPKMISEEARDLAAAKATILSNRLRAASLREVSKPWLEPIGRKRKKHPLMFVVSEHK